MRQPSSKIAIKVYPDCRVLVAAPEAANDEEVLAAAQKRSRWIYQQLREFRQQNEQLTPRQYISGESHLYLGKQYLLKVNLQPNERQSVKLLRGKLEISVRQRDPERIKNLLADWYKERAREVFARRLTGLLEKTLWVTEVPPLHLLSMQTQWGSCSPKGRISLNPHLVKAPSDCIDYVILHELCHLVEHNHSERFYRLLNQVMPEWKAIKQRLDAMAARILLV